MTTSEKKSYLRDIITSYSEEINNKEFDKIFPDLNNSFKIVLLEFLLNFLDRNELLKLVTPFKASNQEILEVVENVLDYFKQPYNSFCFLEEIIEFQLDLQNTDNESKKAYVSALHLVGVPEIYDVKDGLGYTGFDQDYLIGNGKRSLSKWIDEINREEDADYKLSDFRRLW